MKFIFKFLLSLLLFNSVGLSQSSYTQISKGRVSSPDSLPVIYIPGIMGSPLYNDGNDDNKLEDIEKGWIGPDFLSMYLAENGIDPLNSQNIIKVAPIRNDTGTHFGMNSRKNHWIYLKDFLITWKQMVISLMIMMLTLMKEKIYFVLVTTGEKIMPIMQNYYPILLILY